MEAIVFFVLFGLYIAIRVLLGGGASAWEKQVKLHLEGLILLQTGKKQQARTYFEAALRRRPFDAVVLVSLGELELAEGNAEKALALGQKAIRLDNSVAETHLLMSKGLYQLNEFDLALAFARKAVHFGRRQSEPNRWFGTLLLEQGKIDEGITHLEKSYSLLEQEIQTASKPFSLSRSGRY